MIVLFLLLLIFLFLLLLSVLLNHSATYKENVGMCMLKTNSLGDKGKGVNKMRKKVHKFI